jgi:glycosyltransferase involved in cell wall biosynthesis
MITETINSENRNATRTFMKKIKNEQAHTVLPEVSGILLITSYPPRECGIATYSQDLLKAIHNKFSDTFHLTVCALQSTETKLDYPDEVAFVLNPTDARAFLEMAISINADDSLSMVLIQHEFGLFEGEGHANFIHFLNQLNKPATIVFHTVLPQPSKELLRKVREITSACEAIVVMTNHSAQLLNEGYGILRQRITVIPHGVHLVPNNNRDALKNKYGLTHHKVLSTFGLLSSGKGIETTLRALPAIIANHPDVIFLIIGKTHPSVVRSEGEKYRGELETIVASLAIEEHVRFINHYLPLDDLLEYLQLTDIYLFTSKDPYQAVSGTFSYAMSCGCPIISTPIPHAKEVLQDGIGILIDFQNSNQLAQGVNRLLGDNELRKAYSNSTLQRIVPAAWENSAISHVLLFQKLARQAHQQHFKPAVSAFSKTHRLALLYNLPVLNLNHVHKLTTHFGIIQFAKINQPDLESGYTLDDNARALIATCMHYELTNTTTDLDRIDIYLDFLCYCQQPDGCFLNYIDHSETFNAKNDVTNLADANGRAIWALGYLISKSDLFGPHRVEKATLTLHSAFPAIEQMHSTRAIAFAIKGLYFYNRTAQKEETTQFITLLANRLVQMYRHESDRDWKWYESYLTYANSILPEALLYAYLETGLPIYKEIAKTSFDFLLSLTFVNDRIRVVSNKNWLQRGDKTIMADGGEQPIDVAYTILALPLFYELFHDEKYLRKMAQSFSWFLGNNHLHQIIYNPCTGGCYDGLEEKNVNLNQGAESTLSYLLARLVIEGYVRKTT